MPMSDAKNDQPQPTEERPRPPAADRALAEAAARAAAREAAAAPKQKEVGGPSGPDPVRYGDWEHKGIASDF